MCEQIRHGEIGQIDVGRGLHVFVPNDDETGGDVAEDADGEDAGVHRGDGDDGGEGEVAGAQSSGDVTVDVIIEQGGVVGHDGIHSSRISSISLRISFCVFNLH